MGASRVTAGAPGAPGERSAPGGGGAVPARGVVAAEMAVPGMETAPRRRHSARSHARWRAAEIFCTQLQWKVDSVMIGKSDKIFL